ncbi:hypothetical protein CC1G_11071 [Coprinopsis cinerea okayama7|uniref:Uncharacterized protein n=1 Tax=Coprinopsis cinerea (strain Okayama-7 / 130 / ATCC MYA-4618 / FGSC 9003) TaxID=240176 RepID=A8NCA2_COPC7|nr:hypothetical protein CC1G_11071 [Coprinopsis cinerea okayama7\|eukprot:XP_001832446.2 hypothetical protein CC1G_11071 [Coprinopsis cinerea okayama7\
MGSQGQRSYTISSTTTRTNTDMFSIPINKNVGKRGTTMDRNCYIPTRCCRERDTKPLGGHNCGGRCSNSTPNPLINLSTWRLTAVACVTVVSAALGAMYIMGRDVKGKEQQYSPNSRP